MIHIKAHPRFINLLRIFDWDDNLQVDWHNFLDHCGHSNIATIIVDDMTIIFLKTTTSTDEGYEWRMTKHFKEAFPDELIYVMNLQKYDLEFLTKIQKDKYTGAIYGTYFKILKH